MRPLGPTFAGAVLMAHTPLGGAVCGLPQGLFLGLLAWLFYLGFEPAMRPAWHHLLIGSTRLLDGRRRDPLVGRAVLAGILVGLLLVVRLLDRRTDITVLIVVSLFVGGNYLMLPGIRPATISAWLLLVLVVLYSLLFVRVFWRQGCSSVLAKLVS